MTTVAPTLARKMRLPVIVAGIVLVWFAVAEIATYAWYAAHESKLPRNPVPATGEEVLKRARAFADDNGRGADEREIGDTAMEMLKCSFGKTLLWSSYGSGMSAVTILKWDERSVVGGVDAMHNPGTCLRAAGWTVGARSSLGVQNYCGVTAEVTRWEVSQQNTQMQAYSAIFRRYVETTKDEAGPKLWNSTRLKSVISGRRDAPLMILLAYLPVDIDSAASDAKFQQIMKAIFCNPDQ
jgi:hypothetical protein